MNAIKSTDTIYTCSKCRATYEDVRDAESCCRCVKCGKETNDQLGGHVLCKECANRNMEEVQESMYRRATKIPLSMYKNPFVYVYIDEQCLTTESFAHDEIHKDKDWAFAASAIQAKDILKTRLLIDIFRHHHLNGGSIQDIIVDKEELIEFVDKWVEKQVNYFYIHDFYTVVFRD